ncbi:MAG: glycoside hydrolase family 3 N-terminal domain-containing protein [Melioribacteraceae bacterium]
MMKNFCFLVVLILLGINNSLIHSQTLREKIGQMIWASFTGTRLNDTIKVDLQRRNLGGVILYAGNIVNPNQIKLLNDTIKLFSKTPSFIAVDQEGGKVARLNSTNGFKNSYTAYTLGTVFNREDSTRKSASTMASWLKQCGFNVNLAPVVDVNVNPNSPAIGKLERSFSQNPETVSQHGAWFIDEFNKKNILTCLKHFPGHGSALQDSHLGFTDITNTWLNSELVPYQSLFSQGYKDLLMIGHLYNAHLDSAYPASLSKNVTTDILRNQLGFNGVTITDGMAMQAITLNYSFEDAVEYAVNAGNDILLYTSVLRNGSSLVRNVIGIIEEKVNQRKISLNRIEESYNRIIQLKAKYGIITSIDQITKASIPTGFVLYQNYPNPFNPATTISFSLPSRSFVSLKVFDALGKIVATLVNEDKSAGHHQVHFNGSQLSSGVYYYQLHAENFIQTKKLILIK